VTTPAHPGAGDRPAVAWRTLSVLAALAVLALVAPAAAAASRRKALLPRGEIVVRTAAARRTTPLEDLPELPRDRPVPLEKLLPPDTEGSVGWWIRYQSGRMQVEGPSRESDAAVILPLLADVHVSVPLPVPCTLVWHPHPADGEPQNP
jgi:hypothetical protein